MTATGIWGSGSKEGFKLERSQVDKIYISLYNYKYQFYLIEQYLHIKKKKTVGTILFQMLESIMQHRFKGISLVSLKD